MSVDVELIRAENVINTKIVLVEKSSIEIYNVAVGVKNEINGERAQGRSKEQK